ncbi:hypothetical protein [Amycolatopsis sp. FDAARGOS 1241]|uniref:hypothetical protein n=1 Tax=Amycolatopsis sp. FDAARGOS 1241 TaxID=2778070 RepID=UPI0019512FC7|nr:hypothetical protein [Amycolatopsis sp. FDAARGOS 1241]QRP48953.1 hypothetical protein I6J71_14775 [Amycolatopsis sp. FDAARGOS 1241]
MTSKRFARVAVVAALPILVTAVPAGTQAEATSPATVAPACVRLEQWETQDIKNKEWNSWAKMTNLCFQTFTVRMIWSWARDGDCRILDPESAWTEGRLGPHPSVSELRLC